MGYDMYLASIAKTLTNLGLTYSEQLKLEEAEQMHLEALKIKRKIAENYPDQVLPDLALTFLDLGDLYASLDRFEDAGPMFKSALGVYKKLAQQSPDIYLHNIAIIQNSLGTIYTKLENFEEAGLSQHIDARLADAHELVKELKGPFDFVFSDADKEWYREYFIILAPKLEVGGCFTAHNVSRRDWRGIREFLDYVESLPNFETTINSSGQEGLSMSYKKAEN